MRSDTKPLNSVSLDLLQRKNQIACPHCFDVVMGGRSRSALDDSGTVAITPWNCAECGGVIEEASMIMHGRTSGERRFDAPRSHENPITGRSRSPDPLRN